MSLVIIHEEEDNFNDNDDSFTSTQTSTHVLDISDNKQNQLPKINLKNSELILIPNALPPENS